MKKKWMAGLLACLMLLGATSNTFPARAAGSNDPEFTLLASNIKDQYLEVALVLNGGASGRTFLNTGISVEYDAKKLTPVDWAGNPYASIGSSWSNATRLDTKGSDAISGKMALLFEASGAGHLYLSAEAVQTLTVPAGTSIQAVTVRFAYKGTPTAGNYGEVGYELNDSIAAASPAMGLALYSAGTANTSVAVDRENPGGYFRHEQNGVTVDGGSGSTSDFHTVVFYDWDNTLLGSRIVATGGSLTGDHTTPGERGPNANQAPLPPEYNLLWDVNGDGEYTFIANNSPYNDAANKMGYTFAGWVDYTAGYSVPNVDAAAARGQKIPENDLISLTNIKSNLILKAAYNEDSSLIGPNTATRRYLISYTPFIAQDGALQTTITVRRPQNARRSVEGDAYLQIALQPNGRGQTLVTIPLGKTDAEEVTFSMPNTASSGYDPTTALVLTVLDSRHATVSAETTITAADIVAH